MDGQERRIHLAGELSDEVDPFTGAADGEHQEHGELEGGLAGQSDLYAEAEFDRTDRVRLNRRERRRSRPRRQAQATGLDDGVGDSVDERSGVADLPLVLDDIGAEYDEFCRAPRWSWLLGSLDDEQVAGDLAGNLVGDWSEQETRR